MQAYYHLTDPILERYWLWVKNFFHHGFGYPVSLQVDGDTVSPSTGAISGEVLHAGWITLQLVAASLVLVVLLSLALGTVSARRRSGPVDVMVRLLTYVSWSIPTFLIAFFFRRWFTGDQTASTFVYGPQTIGYHGNPAFLIGPPTGGLVDWFQHMTLPAVALALGLVGVYSRYVALGDARVPRPALRRRRAWQGLERGARRRPPCAPQLADPVRERAVARGGRPCRRIARGGLGLLPRRPGEPDDRRARPRRPVRADCSRDHARVRRDRLHDARRPRRGVARPAGADRGVPTNLPGWPTRSSSSSRGSPSTTGSSRSRPCSSGTRGR